LITDDSPSTDSFFDALLPNISSRDFDTSIQHLPGKEELGDEAGKDHQMILSLNRSAYRVSLHQMLKSFHIVIGSLRLNHVRRLLMQVSLTQIKE
jgi:hypothetical protein